MLLFLAILLAVVALIGMLVNPAIGIPLLLAGKPIIDTTFDTPLVLGFPLTQMVGTAVPFVMFLWMLRASPEQGLRRMPLTLLWSVFALDVFFFSMLVVYNEGPLRGLDVLFRHINGFVGFFMFQAFFRDPRKLKTLLIALIVAGVFPVAVGLYQAATGKIWHFQQTEGLVRSIGMYHDVLTLRLHAITPIIAILLYASLWHPRNMVLKLTAIGYAAAAAFVILRAYTKAGTAVLVLWGLIWTILQRKFAALAALLAMALLVLPFYAEQLVENLARVFRKEFGAIEGSVDVEQSFEGRWFGWEEMLNRWLDLGPLEMVFGAGVKAYGAHNDYLQILFHGGILGLSIYLSLLIVIGLRVLQNLRQRVDPLAVAAFMLFTMYLIDTIGLVPSSYPTYQWLVWGLIGLSFRQREDEARERRAERRRLARISQATGP
jgi:hypothetical protein